MACLVVKHDGNYNPHHTKSHAIVLGNHEDFTFNESQRFTPFLSYSSLWLLAFKTIDKRRIFQQVDYKSSFCNALLPEDDITIVLLPLVDPDSIPDDFWILKKTLYCLRLLPQNWYNLITNILKDMGLTSSNHNPCLFYDIIDDDTPHTTPRYLIHVGLYVDDFFFLLGVVCRGVSLQNIPEQKIRH